ncbi:glycosyltransferase 18, Xyloglucan L-side chain galactosylTransferase position 2 [Hibiscus trionum]|uniref:Glycosyltransferase 18, Xyloglucan L-side chain galactosylTransferase position 2 n=1 Tax=Hibiscus trionum TaxID=183268 RepID=A0A9W7MQC8_HIBTR|nr:glycosyltransferase 18, Xyloglucan L-side chain galactosylTransferase position 2 [Hibiscus trionum]
MLPKTSTVSTKLNSIERKCSSNSNTLHLPPLHHRLWLLLFVVSLQITILFMARYHRRTHYPSPEPDPCSSGRIYVYNLPPVFNQELLDNCDELNPWSSSCEALSNGGLGKKATGLSGVVPEELIPAWYWTDQFAMEIIYHNRILNHKCRTMEPDSATAFYIPFYAGLAVGKYLWSNYSSTDRDRYCEMILKWVQDQPYWNGSDGWDHFMTMGRITWDFRRSKNEDWGSRCIYMPGMRNITRLLIERNPWDYFDVGVPYPSGFHPRSDSDIFQWQHFVRNRRRKTLFCFAGAPRGEVKNDFRGLLLSQCNNASGLCRAVDCAGSRCSNGTSAILETFLDSDFCLQPRGDSFSRRSIFDCMIAGSIPVFFWHRSAYLQYEWFLPSEWKSYSVFIHRDEVKTGRSIKNVLESYSREEVKKMREKVIEYIPKLVYAKPEKGLESIKDAFDVAIDGVLKRNKEHEQPGYKWRR